MTNKLRLNCSVVQTFLNCRQKYKWQRIERLYPRKKSAPLMVGDFVHRLLSYYALGKLETKHFENLDKLVEWAYPNEDKELTYDVAVEAARLVSGYLQRWDGDTSIKYIASETHLEWEEPEFFLYGRVDGLVRDQNEALWRWEIKTASRMDSSFLSGQKGSLQTGIYNYLLRRCLKEERIKGTIFDLLVKTKIPQFDRALVAHSPYVTDMALETFRGVARDIQRGDFYPSTQCFNFNQRCEYYVLCTNDSPSNREAFFETRDMGKGLGPKDHSLEGPNA